MSRNQIRQRCRENFTQAIKQIQQETSGNSNEYIIILDSHTKSIISSLFTVGDILNMGVLFLEKLELQRKPFPNANGIYYVNPSETSLQRIFKDFQDKKNPQYLSISLLFSGQISKELMVNLGEQQNVMKRLAVFREYRLDVNFLTSNVMNLGMTPELALKDEMVERVMENLLFIATSIPNYYAFDILYPQQSKYCQRLAVRLSQALKEEKLQPSADSQFMTVVISQRKVDPVSPLFHSLHYEALLKDLFKSSGNRLFLSPPEVNPPDVRVLDETDKLFCKYRYNHISQCLQDIKKDFKADMQKSEAAKFQKGDNQANLAQTIRQLPQFNKTKNQFNTHFDLLKKTNDLIAKKNLARVAELQQSIATGFNNDGDELSQKFLLTNGLQYVNNKTVEEMDKMRVMLIMIMCMELKAKDREQFIKELKAKYENIDKAIQYLCPKRMRLRDRKRNKKEEEMVLLGNRHCPILADIVGSIQQKKEYLGLRSLKINNIQDKMMIKTPKLGAVKKQQRDRILVYMAGGISFSEICQIEKVSSSNVYYCASKIVTPSQYVETMAQFANQT